MRRKNRPPKLSVEKFVYTVVLTWATFYSVRLLVLDF